MEQRQSETERQLPAMAERIMACLGEVYDPELGINIVDLGLIYHVMFREGEAVVYMTLTTPGCPMHDMMVGGVRYALEQLPEVVSANVHVVWEPRWQPSMMSEKAREELNLG